MQEHGKHINLRWKPKMNPNIIRNSKDLKRELVDFTRVNLIIAAPVTLIFVIKAIIGA